MSKSTSTSSLLLYGIAALAVIGLIVVAVRTDRGPSPYTEFASCLSEQGLTMYGAWWCPHCNDQKALFGSAFNEVNYIECSPGNSRQMSQECRDAGIQGYPTWDHNGEAKRSGVLTLEALAEISGCELPEA